MAGKVRYVGYLKSEFASRLIPAIKRPDVLLYLREFEKTGKLETRDRIRATGEQICVYADVKRRGLQPVPQSQKTADSQRIGAAACPDRSGRCGDIVSDHRGAF